MKRQKVRSKMGVKEKALTAASSIASGDFLRMVTGGGASRKIDYSKLAKAIVEEYNGSTIAGSAQTLKVALDSLNSKTSGWRMNSYNVSDNDSIDIPLEAPSRGMMFSTGAGATSRGSYAYGVSTSGIVSGSALISASGIAYTNGTNKMTVTNTSGAYATIFVLRA